jgi:predicted small metal-binding protein
MKLLTCKDFGIDCPAEFRGETFEQVLEQAKRHGMTSHGQTREQAESADTRQIAEAKVRDEK